MVTIIGAWEDGPDEPHTDWVRRSWTRLRPWSSGGGYVNHLSADEGVARVREAYGPATFDRLVALKRSYDPANVFHLNQNIDPHASTATPE
jgi:FAD/FMN-containing dehydrogenase